MMLLRLVLALVLFVSYAQSGNERLVSNALTVIGRPNKRPCPECAAGTPVVSVTEDQLKNLRIDFIKSQMLKKLQLTEVPKVNIGQLPMSVPASIPKPILPQINEPPDGKTNQVILLGYPDSNCNWNPDNGPSTCIGFTLPGEMLTEKVGSVSLWVYKNHDFMDDDRNSNQTLTYYDFSDGNPFEIERHNSKVIDGLIRLNFTTVFKNWLKDKKVTRQILVSCPTCGYKSPWKPISVETGQQPILAVNIEEHHKKRQRRNVDCSPDISECCREKLRVNFKDINWDHWVFQPLEYDAYYCAGSCTNAASATLSTSVYSTIFRKLHTKKVELVPCCTATQMSPIQMLIATENTTVKSLIIPDMVVETCGCK